MGMIAKKAGGASALGLALGAAMMMAQPVIAAPVQFNFDLIANSQENAWGNRTNGPVDGGTFSGGVNSKIYSKGGISVSASASNTGTAQPLVDSFAYLDAGNAGLGVCSTSITGTNTSTNMASSRSNVCGVSSDDNTGVANGGSEVLKLKFGPQAVALTKLRFRNSEHGNYNGKIVIDNGGDSTTFDISAGVLDSTGLGFGTMWSFAYEFSEYLGSTTKNNAGFIPGYFYLSGATATIPLPAGVLLLGSALGGLGLMGRRRKAA